jgi:ATP-dependent DNA helicase RecQ
MTSEKIDQLEKLLKQVFGFTSFRPGQLEIIETILAKRNVLAVMPTGAGKSLCYQLPAIYSEQKTIIVSPLVALMDDQVSSLSQLGVQVSKIHSGVSRQENVEHWKRFASNECNILYLSPERLMQTRMVEALKHFPIGLFVVDEAHCISKWGANFRPDYENLTNLKFFFPDAKFAAFTATADKATRSDIVKNLTNGDCSVFVSGFDRPNLSLKVLPKQNLKSNILHFLSNKKNESGIVYCLSRKDTDQLSSFLHSKGFNAISYHAGKTPEYRLDAQNRFMTEEAAVMVATVAFGMGIDKPDIRYVVHASMPGSVEAFYQEIGRAGRDGAPAETIMYYGVQDMVSRQRMIFEGNGGEQHKLLEYRRLEALIGYCETSGCRRLALLSYFDETVVKCGNCDNCTQPPKVEDYSNLAKQVITAIKQTGQYFGMAHVIDVVRGSETQKIKVKSHEALEIFGIAKTQSRQTLQSLIRQMIAGNALKVNLEKFGALEITDRGSRILHKNEQFMAKAISKVMPTVPAKSLTPTPLKSHDNSGVLVELKKIRLALAKERSVPAFVIFPDKTLIQMAEELPTTESQFLAINGVGNKKFVEFCDRFQEVIRKFKVQQTNSAKNIVPTKTSSLQKRLEKHGDNTGSYVQRSPNRRR